MTRHALAAVLVLAFSAGCRDEGLVGEGSACPQACSDDERCVDGECEPARGGAAGDDSEGFDEDGRDHGGDGHDNDGPGDEPSGDEGPGDKGSGDPPFPEL